MIRAAARGVVDFAQARPFDPRWSRRLRWLIDAMQDDDEYRLELMLHHHHSNTMIIPSLTADSYDNAKRERSERLRNLQYLTYPWLKPKDGEDSKKAEYQEARDQWVSRYGDPNDPEVQKKIEATAAALMQQHTDAVVPVTSQAKNKRQGSPDSKRRRR